MFRLESVLIFDSQSVYLFTCPRQLVNFGPKRIDAPDHRGRDWRIEQRAERSLITKLRGFYRGIISEQSRPSTGEKRTIVGRILRAVLRNETRVSVEAEEHGSKAVYYVRDSKQRFIFGF